MKHFLSILFYIACLYAPLVQGQSLESLKRDSLRGISDLKVVVEDLSEDAERAGLTRETLQAEIELRLRQLGIRVVGAEDVQKTPGNPYLYINVNAYLITDTQIFAVGIDVSLRQYARLVNNPKILIPVATWDKSSTGDVGRDKLSSVRKAVLDYVNVFANDFLSVNGKV